MLLVSPCCLQLLHLAASRGQPDGCDAVADVEHEKTLPFLQGLLELTPQQKQRLMAMRHFYFTQQARILRHRRKIREALQVITVKSIWNLLFSARGLKLSYFAAVRLAAVMTCLPRLSAK